MMKNIERGSIKYLFALIITVAICGMILYPIFDLLLCKFITNSNFEYSIHQHIIQPVIFAIVYGIVYWLFEKKRK